MIDCLQFLEQLDELSTHDPDLNLTPEMRDHCRQCEACAAQYAELQEAWLLLASGLAPVPVPAGLEAQIIGRIASAQHVAPTTRFPVATIAKYALAASVLIALIAGTLQSWPRSPEITRNDLEQMRELTRQMQELERLEGIFADSHLTYVSLQAVGSDQKIRGYVVYDLIGHQGHFFGFDFPPADNHFYVVWLINKSQSVISTSVIDVAPDHLGTALVSLPENLEELHEVLVTVETRRDVATPSSDIALKATVGLDR